MTGTGSGLETALCLRPAQVRGDNFCLYVGAGHRLSPPAIGKQISDGFYYHYLVMWHVRVTQAVLFMTRRDPERRSPSVHVPLEQLRDSGFFPDYFDSCLYPLFKRLRLHSAAPDDQIFTLCEVTVSLEVVWVEIDC